MNTEKREERRDRGTDGGTKEKILLTALRLFAKNGYEAVSVGDIAGEIGITKGALYRHYTSKRDIFDKIVERMYLLDTERSEKYALPEQPYAVSEDGYRSVTPEQIEAFTKDYFHFWATDTFASDFRKMLTLEQFRDPETAKLYRNCLSSGPVAYLSDLFREMTAAGILAQENADLLATEYFSPFYYLLSVAEEIGTDEAEKRLAECSEHFFKERTKEKKQ